MTHGLVARANSDTHIGSPVPLAMTARITIAAKTRLIAGRVEFGIGHSIVIVMITQVIGQPVQDLNRANSTS